MKKNWCLFLLLAASSACFAQTKFEYPVFRFGDLLTLPCYSSDLTMFRPVQMALENEQESANLSIFANAPQWLKDIRRGEIVFFGTLPFTVFFTRIIMSVYNMSQHNWDQRYAPWPFQPAGAVAFTKNQLFWMFSFSGSASLVISLADHFIVRHKRNAAPADDE